MLAKALLLYPPCPPPPPKLLLPPSEEGGRLGRQAGNRVKRGGIRGRGSSVAVKEQRVDGNWCIKKSQAMHLRCTLMGSERNFQVKILSKQRDVAKFTTMSMPSNDISPWFFLIPAAALAAAAPPLQCVAMHRGLAKAGGDKKEGFADAEGSFSILIQNRPY